MKGNFKISKLIAAIIIVIIPSTIVAQERLEGVAKINKIIEGQKEFKNPTSLAQIRRGNQGNWLNVKKNDELYFNDILKLDKDIWLRVNIKNSLQNSTLSLLSTPADSILKELKEPGRYKIYEDNVRSGKVAIELMQGTAIFNVLRDAITTITGGLISVVESGSTTRALYRVNTDGSGEIFLQQGHLLFPGNSKVPGLMTGQVAQFQNGQITNVFFPDIPLATKYNNFIKYNNSTVWKKPFLKRPTTWIGAAAVGIGTALIIIKPWATNEVTGTINVNWGSN